MTRLTLTLLLAIPTALTGGYLLNDLCQPQVEFHNLRTNPTDDYVGLINSDDPAIRALAARLKTPEAAYRFVSDEIAFAPFVPPGPVAATLEYRMGSCLGKAVLLCSLYRALGMPAANARIVMGIVITPEGEADHVWIDMEDRGRCLQQDPSGMLGRFAFDAFPGTSYVATYVVKETLCFNEKGLAIVSQLNRMRSNSAPGMALTD